MKKIYSTICMGIIASALFLPVTSHSQDLTDAERLERCQNNKNRIAELEAQLRIINEDISQAMEPKEIEDARTQRVFLTGLLQDGRIKNDEMNRLKRIAAQYNFQYQNCVDKNITDVGVCIRALRDIIAKKIDKAVSLDRVALQAKKNETEKQLTSHRNNLITYRCDEPADNEKTADISGTWSYSTVYIYSITQNGSKFTWYLAKIKQKAEGTITGKSVSATWFYEDGSFRGSATGTVKVDASGGATSIEWSNGVVFIRN